MFWPLWHPHWGCRFLFFIRTNCYSQFFQFARWQAWWKMQNLTEVLRTYLKLTGASLNQEAWRRDSNGLEESPEELKRSSSCYCQVTARWSLCQSFVSDPKTDQDALICKFINTSCKSQSKWILLGLLLGAICALKGKRKEKRLWHVVMGSEKA